MKKVPISLLERRVQFLKILIKQFGYPQGPNLEDQRKDIAMAVYGEINEIIEQANRLVGRMQIKLIRAYADYQELRLNSKVFHRIEVPLHLGEDASSILRSEKILNVLLLDNLLNEFWPYSHVNKGELLHGQIRDEALDELQMHSGQYKEFIEKLFEDVDSYELRLEKRKKSQLERVA